VIATQVSILMQAKRRRILRDHSQVVPRTQKTPLRERKVGASGLVPGIGHFDDLIEVGQLEDLSDVA
jgi:hypothetical protein